MKSLALLFTILFCCGTVDVPAALAQSTRLDRYQLLQYRAADGSIQPVTNSEQWKQRRAEIIQGMVQVMGPFPGPERRVPIDIQIEKEDDVGSYVRRLITYQSEPDSRTPAWLCIPRSVLDGSQQAPAALCLHPTDNTVGHDVVVGLGGRAGRQYAAELAERGYVTLSPAYPHLANYWPNLGKLGYVSGTMKAIWDSSRGIDLLASLPYVDTKNGVAAIGHSLGGHNAIYSAVFDDRITVIASSCGFDSYLDYYDGTQNVWYFDKGWCQIRYMPRMSNYRGRLEDIPFDFPELLGVLAPRPLFVNAPLGDSNFRWKSVDRCIDAARPVYRMLTGTADITDRVQVLHPDCPHDFPDESRQAAYTMIDSVLRPRDQ
ncbi:MAG: acetylxylan esterase [Planctomycetaceae bacterium]